jgi:hypothetical protein
MKGICFKEDLFKKVVSGEKTMTRRIITPQPDSRGLRTTNVMFEDWHGKKRKPRYNVGDIIYLKEPCGRINGIMFYAYDYAPGSKMRTDFKGWGNKLFMKAENARFKIQITDVRVERAQDITEEDAIREGCKDLAEFQTVWMKINGISSWKKNPWVFTYEFKRI